MGKAVDSADREEGMKRQEATNHVRSTIDPRATRFEIVTTVWYRVRGETTWHEGMLQNFSISGMLFTAEQPLKQGTSIEMKFTLPIELEGKHAADLSCRGFVVRSERQGMKGSAVHIAAKVLHSHLLRHSELK
jgi:hypothetical protein